MEANSSPLTDLPRLDGFLTGILVGPRQLNPKDWIHLVWESGVRHSADPAQSDVIVELLKFHYNRIASALENPETWLPILTTGSDGTVDPTPWANSFAAALEADGEWARFLQYQDLSRMILPLLILGSTDEERRRLDLPPVREMMDRTENAAELIRDTVRDILGFWESGPPRPKDRPYIPKGPKIGRNEPCPCGSGKKFKHCCGGPDPA